MPRKGRPPKNLPDPDPAPPGALVPAPTPSVRDQAKALYLERKSLEDISAALGCSQAQLADWRTTGEWVAEREELDRALLEDRFASRRRQVSRIADATVEQLERGMKHLAERPEPPSVTEAEKLTAVLVNLDKMNRLDLGRATDNLAVSGKLSVERIRDIIKADPFFVNNPINPEPAE